MEMSHRRSATQDWNCMVMNNKHRRHYANIVGTWVTGTCVTGTCVTGTCVTGTEVYKTNHARRDAECDASAERSAYARGKCVPNT